MPRYFYNTEFCVVCQFLCARGDYSLVSTKNGPRIWWNRFLKEIDYEEYSRCINAKVPNNKPKYFINYEG